MRAVVDIGSNTFKTLIGETRRPLFHEVASKSIVVRLAQGLSQGGSFHPDALLRAENALQELKQFINQYAVESLDIIATASVRKAHNPSAISNMVKTIFNKELEVISGIEEARLSTKGACLALALLNIQADAACFFDVGGASTEISILDNPLWSHSFDIGAVSAHDLLKFPQNAVDEESWKERTKNLKKFFSKTPLSEAKEKAKGKIYAVAAGGTLLQMAHAMKAQEPIDGVYVLNLSEIKLFLEKARKLSQQERISQYGIEAGRADIFPAGISLFEYLCDELELKSLIISKMGLRHGFLLDRY